MPDRISATMKLADVRQIDDVALLRYVVSQAPARVDGAWIPSRRACVPSLSATSGALCTRLARRSAERRMALGEGGIRGLATRCSGTSQSHG